MNPYMLNPQDDDIPLQYHDEIVVLGDVQGNGDQVQGNGEEAYRTDWAASEAKQILESDIMEQRINGMTPMQVYHDPERHDVYKYYKYTNFRTNLRNLRKKVHTQTQKAQRHRASHDKHMAS